MVRAQGLGGAHDVGTERSLSVGVQRCTAGMHVGLPSSFGVRSGPVLVLGVSHVMSYHGSGLSVEDWSDVCR